MRLTKYTILSACALMTFASCDEYLDKLPDDRAEMNSADKVTQILVSAYPSASSNIIMELSSDNVTDNGKSYTTSTMFDELYRFKDVDDTGNDSPYQFWDACYNAIATANTAIQTIHNLNDSASLAAQMSEAKLCRAFAMFQLANVFCMAYNPDKADEYLGLPYPTVPDLVISERGTLSELYAKINKDIEEALPAVSDSYTVPKYHFNTKAAYAFAAKFNLYYMNYEKAIEYATHALGDDPSGSLRDYPSLMNSGAQDLMNLYISSSEAANFLLLPSYSGAGVYLGLYSVYTRFRHNNTMCSYETYWASMPWGSGSSDNPLYYSSKIYGTNQLCYFPKIDMNFEYTDKVNGIGYYHIVDPVFTADETLLYRAEAYALSGDYDNAVDDINAWIVSHCAESKGGNRRPTVTASSIETFFDGLEYAPVDPEGNRDRSPRKTFNPQGFTVSAGTQEALIQFILHMRRLEMISQGTRFMDCKRYGIEFSHKLSGEDPVIFSAGDLRGAIQIPSDVANAGMEKNPR